MKKLTNQDVFDIVIEGIFKQGGPSFSFEESEYRCQYRAESGRKCAAGLILPDKEYEFIMEGLCVNAEEIVWFRENVEDITFLLKLQESHDTYIYPDEFTTDEEFFKNWTPEMNKIADDYNLDKSLLLKHIKK